MGNSIYFNKKELEELHWIVTMYRDTHEPSWREGVCLEEEPTVIKLIEKIRKS